MLCATGFACRAIFLTQNLTRAPLHVQNHAPPTIECPQSLFPEALVGEGLSGAGLKISFQLSCEGFAFNRDVTLQLNGEILLG
jgi:hypothetical protein